MFETRRRLPFPAPRGVFALVSAGLIGLSLGACRPAPPAGDTDAAAGDPRDSALPSAGGSAPRTAPRAALEPRDVLAVRWPSAFRVVDSGAFGPDALPVVWYHLESANADPKDAVAALLDALRPLAGEIALEDLMRDADSGTVVGQLRGSALAASATGRAARGVTTMRATIEVLPR